MTVAQLVHPVRDLAWPGGATFGPLRRVVAAWRSSCDATLWREIVTGLGFALVGLLMLGVALGAAGSAAPSSAALAASSSVGSSAAPGVAQAMPARHTAIYQNPAEALTDAMPVP